MTETFEQEIDSTELWLRAPLHDEIGEIIVAEVDAEHVRVLLDPEQSAPGDLIYKRQAVEASACPA